MTDTAPLTTTVEREAAAAAATADVETDLTIAATNSTVAKVTYVAATVLTGADTNSRTVNLVNKGQSGAGSTVVATKAFTSGVNAAADDDTAITLSGTAANLAVTAGDVLVWQSTHVGSSGLADPGGLVHVELSRS